MGGKATKGCENVRERHGKARGGYARCMVVRVAQLGKGEYAVKKNKKIKRGIISL